MIDLKPPEEELTVNCSDMKKFTILFDEVGIEYEQVGNELEIAPIHFDGKDGLIVKFFDNQQFKEFDDIGMHDRELHSISNTLKDILREMRKRKV